MTTTRAPAEPNAQLLEALDILQHLPSPARTRRPDRVLPDAAPLPARALEAIRVLNAAAEAAGYAPHLTPHGLALALGANQRTVGKVLHRLRQAGKLAEGSPLHLAEPAAVRP